MDFLMKFQRMSDWTPTTKQVQAEAWDEGKHAGQHNEHEYRQGRAMTNPMKGQDR